MAAKSAMMLTLMVILEATLVLRPTVPLIVTQSWILS